MKKYLAFAAMAAALAAPNLTTPNANNHLPNEFARIASGKGIGSLSRHKAKMKCKIYCKK